VILVLGGLLMSCGTRQEGQTIGAPTDTVEQVRQWPQGLEPAGDFRGIFSTPSGASSPFLS
jgi:hypothetical protein